MPILLPFLIAAVASAAGPADLGLIKEGERSGACTAAALYLDPGGAPKGARFIHKTGTPVDVLFFDSIPQVSVYWRAPAPDDRGAAHTLEHLLLGKGRAGRKLNTMMALRMGEYTAGTHNDITNYQLSSAAGPAEFYELLETFLAALLRPDFTDDEVRGEVAHFAVSEEGGRLKLEEKGTVYDEMVSRMEKPDYALWDGLGRLLYGPEHPLARNGGGVPSEIWKLTPDDIRAFHARHYRLGPGMSLIASLPPSWEAGDFLTRLDGLLERLAVSSAPAAELAPFAPASSREPFVGRFPSNDEQAPREAVFAWPPVPTFSRAEAARLGLALSLLGGGDAGYLQRDLVDQKTRRFDSGVTAAGAYSDTYPASFAMTYVSGLPPGNVSPSVLERVEGVIRQRVAWLHGLEDGTTDYAEAAAKTRAFIRSARRGALKSMDGPPGFGQRFSGAGWHRALDMLAREPGYAKPLTDEAVYAEVLRELDAGINPWAAALERAGMLARPYTAAARADPDLLARQRTERAARLGDETTRLMRGYGLGEQEALARFKAEEPGAADGPVDRAAFLKEPPLALDDLSWAEGRLPSGSPWVATYFPTPFTDLNLSFDLGGLAEADLELLTLLAAAMGNTGVTTRSGEVLDYAQAEDRLREEVFSAGVSLGQDPLRRRGDLSFSAAASSPSEVERAAGWLEDFMLRPRLAARERLVDLLRSGISAQRSVFEQDEESWLGAAAAAYAYQDQPMYMATDSPFTSLRHMTRLRWRLEEDGLGVLRSTLSAVAAAAKDAARTEAAAFLNGVGGELGEFLRWELSHLPEDSWRADLGRLAAETEADLGRSAETIGRLESLAKALLTRARARVHVNGSRENAVRALAAADLLLARLPAGRRPGKAPQRGVVRDRLRQRVPGLGRPVHAALVNPSGKTAAVSIRTPAPGYAARARGDLLDTLSYGVLAGGGAHSLFMRTWAAGLAYANGLSRGFSAGRVSWYADRCLDPVHTLRFVAETAARAAVDDPFLVEYSLADAFGDYRAGGDFSSRGGAWAYELRFGPRPELVRGFKQSLLKLARAPGALEEMRARLPRLMGRVLIGYPGGRVSASPEATAFVVGPEPLLKGYESHLKETGEAESLLRLYPRDFWP